MLRRARSWQLSTGALIILALGQGCDTDHYAPSSLDGANVSTDAQIVIPGDSTPSPDMLPQSNEGPTIVLDTPAAGAIVTVEQLRFEATITDTDGVDPSSVLLTVGGMPAMAMTAKSGTSDSYETLVDLTGVSGQVTFYVVARDMLGNANSAAQSFMRDAGPTITILSPAEEGYYKGSVKVDVLVDDLVQVKRVQAFVGKQELALTKQALTGNAAHYTAVLLFDDPYDPPLSGQQTLVVLAANQNDAETRAERLFYVDDEGPLINITSHAPGDIIGNTVTLKITVADPSGVLHSTVQCVLGDGNDTLTVPMNHVSGDQYVGLFDARNFTANDVWPVLSCRAADLAGNESHVDIEVGLDAAPPRMALDPKAEVSIGTYEGQDLLCSHSFDPVGLGAAHDLERVPQLVPIRAFILDQGNISVTSEPVPVAGIDGPTVRLFVLDDTQKPLVVDTDNDGFCDAINPNVVPLSTVPQQGKAIAVNLAPVPAAGGGDFSTPYPEPFPTGSICKEGTASKPPAPACYRDPSLPVFVKSSECDDAGLWTIPGISPQFCLGLPFDFAANNIADGWVCAAMEARDKVLNHGVSAPIRLWVNKSLTQKDKLLPPGAGAPPDCTGTLDPTTGQVDPNTNCIFRPANQSFPQVFPPFTVLVDQSSATP